MKKIIASISAVIVLGLLIVSCKKELSYEGAVVTPVNSAWQFKQDSTQFSGTFDTVGIIKTGAVFSLVYASGPSAQLSETFELTLIGPITAGGTYKSTNATAVWTYYKNGFPMYESVTGDSSVVFTVAITSITDSTVIGTFSGKVHNANLDTVTIKEGKFSGRTLPIIIVPTVSAGTLGTTADSCTGATIAGKYKKGVALTTTNTVTVSVNVSTIGSYSIGTDTIKGIYFNKTGSFTSTGAQSLTLQGVGTPIDSAAAAKFTVKYGASACKFMVKIDTSTAVVTPVISDYLPLTTNSNWSYDIYDSAANTLDDTLFTKSMGTTITLVGSPFNIFLNRPDGDSTFYKKGGGLYYSVYNLDDFLGTGGYRQTTILKDNVPVGTYWIEIQSVTGSANTLKLDYVIADKAASAVVGTTTFLDVIKVRTVVSLGTTGSYQPVLITNTWFAKNIGLIYNKQSWSTSGGPTLEGKLRRYQVF